MLVVFLLWWAHLWGVYIICQKQYMLLHNEVSEMHAQVVGLNLLLNSEEKPPPSTGESVEPPAADTIIPARVCMSVHGNVVHTLPTCPALRFSNAVTLRHGDNILCTWCRVRTNRS